MARSLKTESQPPAGAARIALVAATHRRPALVQRLVASLATERNVVAICIVDNGSDVQLRSRLEALDRRVRYLDPGRNLGCGAALAMGCQEALKDPSVTHIWMSDDDAIVVPGCGDRLVAAMAAARADLAVPLITGADGKIMSFPGPLEGPAWREIRRCVTPGEFVAACGHAPLEFVWAPGVCLMVTRRTALEAGVPRTEYWLMGDDLEYTCRLSARYRSILVPDARAVHLQPTPAQADLFAKFCAFLTNVTYTTLHFPHGHRMIRHLPGNYLRFLKDYGWTPTTVGLALKSFYQGAIRRKPSGSAEFEKNRNLYLQRG